MPRKPGAVDVLRDSLWARTRAYKGVQGRTRAYKGVQGRKRPYNAPVERTHGRDKLNHEMYEQIEHIVSLHKSPHLCKKTARNA